MHPVLFELFGEPVHLYAVMIAMGFVVAIIGAYLIAEQLGKRAVIYATGASCLFVLVLQLLPKLE